MSAKRPSLSLKGRALTLLVQREHSITELRRKLLRHAQAADAAKPSAIDAVGNTDADEDEVVTEFDADARVDEVIAWLRQHNYLCEERFVESRVHARAGRYGNLRIRQELAQHGVALTPETSQALKESELDRATEVWRRKFAEPPADATDKARHARFLTQRGFSPEVISRVLRNAGYAPRSDEADGEAERISHGSEQHVKRRLM